MAALRKLHRRDVPKEWEDQLAELAPKNDRFTWLKLIWEPGYAWESPVDRFIIYQMVPGHAVEEDIHEQLRDCPPPSQMGNYYDAVLGQFVRNPDCLITERAWHLYRETGCWGRPYWVIQGENGGHKRWFSNVEKQLLKLAGLPTDPPPPGDLPYAPFDERVLAKLRERDMLFGKQAGLRYGRSLVTDATKHYQLEQEEHFRRELVKWLADQVTQVAGENGEELTKALMVMDAPRADIDPGVIQERQEIAEHNYIKHGKSAGGLILLD